MELQVGDRIQRFEVGLSKEIDYIYVIESVTKTLAKTSGTTVFKREIHFNTKKPTGRKHNFIGEVYLKTGISYSTPSYFVIDEEK